MHGGIGEELVSSVSQNESLLLRLMEECLLL